MGGCFESRASKTIADSTDVASKGSIGTRRMLFCLGQRKSFFLYYKLPNAFTVIFLLKSFPQEYRIFTEQNLDRLIIKRIQTVYSLFDKVF